jgi:hypothetical protein
MAAYLLTAVTPDGYGLAYHGGDAYEVEAESYEAAEADVLCRVGADEKPSYSQIVKGWVKDGGVWTELPVARAMTSEELAFTVSCPSCRAGVGERCLRLTPGSLRRVVSRQRILHPHAIRIAKAKQRADQMIVWQAPSGTCHLNQRCTGAASPSRMREIFVSEAEFAGLARCRCLQRFRGA